MDEVLRALKYRAWHRGTREADMMIGGFFDAHHASWGAQERALFAALLTEQDVDIMAWAIGTQPVPEHYQGPMMETFQRLDFINVNRMNQLSVGSGLEPGSSGSGRTGL